MPRLNAGSTTRGEQVYVRDLLDGSLTYVGQSILGGLSSHTCSDPSLSYDGRYVVWESLSEDLTVTTGAVNQGVFVRDLETAVTVQVSQGRGGATPDGFSLSASISGDGRTIAFETWAENQAPGSTPGPDDIFERECSVASPTVCCASKVSASGCKPLIDSSGTPSASAGSGFLVQGSQLVAGQAALVLYGHQPAYASVLGSSWLCIAPPTKRTAARDAGGIAVCDGATSLDMNAWIASGADPELAAGQAVYAQVWSRDPRDVSGAVLSDALAFRVEP